MLGAVRAFFDFLAKMGLTIRDDPPRTVDLSGRQWGSETNGYILSVAAEATVISVVLRNISGTARPLAVPDFSRWFELVVEGAERSPFGKQLIGGAGPNRGRNLTIAAGEAVHAELPIDAIYRLNRNSTYNVSARCAIDKDTVVVSNTVIFGLK